ncbi:Seed maturation protein [Actinidia chinensis var. chinensis]|uniref:Seed maturation protein n=1 Tax=Actinidia chinensis var. chinensis TaxID=1590841 RepID=A0A2R6QRR6_ACTCC|nr:Seed maturation protein [Actinidia chinensis var. chinensis]
MESAKETAAKIAASAKAGMEKTIATVEEKVFSFKRHDLPERKMDRRELTSSKQVSSFLPFVVELPYRKCKLMMGLRSPWMQRLDQRNGRTKIREAERKQQQELEQSTAARRAETVTSVTPTYSTTGTTGTQSALPGYRTGEPPGQVVKGVVLSHPIGTATGADRPSTAHSTNVGYGTNKGYDKGDDYTWKR